MSQSVHLLRAGDGLAPARRVHRHLHRHGRRPAALGALAHPHVVLTLLLGHRLDRQPHRVDADHCNSSRIQAAHSAAAAAGHVTAMDVAPRRSSMRMSAVIAIEGCAGSASGTNTLPPLIVSGPTLRREHRPLRCAGSASTPLVHEVRVQAVGLGNGRHRRAGLCACGQYPRLEFLAMAPSRRPLGVRRRPPVKLGGHLLSQASSHIKTGGPAAYF